MPRASLRRASPAPLLLALLLALLRAGPVSAGINFKQYKSCQPCLDAGYGWCPIRRMCGGFANKNCRGDHTDNVKTDAEQAAEQAERAEADRARRLAEADSEVVAVTQGTDEFARVVGAFSVSLVEFYAPWCGHCKALAPAYEEAAKTLRQEGSKARLVKVDATAAENRALASAHGVKGFPTLKIFRGSEFEEDYGGGRDALDIVEAMRAAAAEAAKPRPKVGRTIDFTMAKASSLLKHKVKRQLMVFGNKATLARMDDALRGAGDRLGPENDGPNMLILKLNTEDSSLRAVIGRFEVPFGTVGPVFRAADNSGAGGLQALRPPFADDDSAAVARAAKMDSAALVALCQDFMDGNFKRVLRSASRPPGQPYLDEPGLAEEIIGSQFESKVIADDTKDSVVFFYMPGCGHCKKLKPEYAKVATYMPLDHPNLNFFTIDGTKNEVESAMVSGYPTVYFYPKGGKSAKTVRPLLVSERDEQGLREFIASNVAEDDVQVEVGAGGDEL